jgi:hypothetical protein
MPVVLPIITDGMQSITECIPAIMPRFPAMFGDCVQSGAPSIPAIMTSYPPMFCDCM